MFVASSLFLFRKAIRSPPASKAETKEKETKYVERMCTPQDPPPPEVYEFTRRILAREFPLGWDSSWDAAVDNFTLPTKSTLESKMAEGGGRGLITGDDEIRHVFHRFVDGDVVPLKNETRISTVQTGGKARIVSVFSYERSFLGPLHKIIYGHLSKKQWLLRGEAVPCRFSDFTRRRGEVFVSGDYESASDNLNIHLSEYIISCLSSSSTVVPDSVWGEARKALRARFRGGGVQARGQLMGSLLSFPLLCITNYLAARFFLRRRVPLRINGDDIVFRSTLAEYHRWAEGVGSWGLTLSQGKTLVSKTVFSLNSAFFRPMADRVEFFPFLRSSCIFGLAETANAVSGRVEKSVVGVSKGTKERVHRLILLSNRKVILGAQRSIRKGLRIFVSRKVINDVRMGSWERYYSALPEIPLPPLWAGSRRCMFVDGWTRVEDVGQEDCTDEFFRELIESCWLPMETRSCDYWDRIKEGTLRYVKPCAKKFAIMAGMTSIEYDDYLRESHDCPPVHVPQRKWVWVRKQRGREMRFAPAGTE